ncbi:hypothetical protein [Aquihabitans sp. McL0605]|uniref:hypothetical protein n=1 Tax=Aquihabitans sp. McL0605 TaxID=3415671 RepID=UPI003CED0A53
MTPPADPTTDGELPFGGWVLRAGQDALDVDAALARFGQVWRCPIPSSERAAQMEPGQPCFLVRTDRSRVIGIWAVGEVVAPCLSLPAGTALLPGEAGIVPDGTETLARSYAEVELLPLAKPIALDKLLADPVLAASELGRAADLLDPLALTPRELRAVEAIEFWMEPPSDELRAALDAVLAREDDILDRLDGA